MIINKTNYKLINIIFINLIIYLIYKTKNIWIILISLIYKIFLPFIIAFIISYILYPFLKKLQKYNISKSVSIIIIFLSLIIFISLINLMIIPKIFNQIGSLFNSILLIIKNIQMKYDFNLDPLSNIITKNFKNIFRKISITIPNKFISFILLVTNYFTFFIITICSSIYLLIDMDKIVFYIKNNTNKKLFKYLSLMNNALREYLNGFFKIICITFFEYTISFLLIDHPNAFILGFLASFSNLIPFFGGILINIIAVITASIFSFKLFIKTIILFIILSIIDGYIINPYIYSKSNNIHPLIIIFSVFCGGILFGIIGIIISLPLAIILLTTYKFLKEYNKIY